MEVMPCGRPIDGSLGYCLCFRRDQIKHCSECGISRPLKKDGKAALVRYLCNACYVRFWRARAREEQYKRDWQDDPAHGVSDG